MIKISRESEVNLINVLIDQDVISGKDLPNIKKLSSEGEKTQLEAVFDLNLTDEDKILDLLVKDQNLDVVELDNMEITDEVKTVLPANYINMNFIAPFKVEGNISDPVSDNPYFDPSKPIRVIFVYLGNNDIVEGNLPITRNIIAGKFSVKIKILKSKVRGAVIVRYQNCKI